ncbi:MAG: VPGUxxT family thioredoxin-like (seleno)protein, type 2 [Bacteroidota bacterium]
MQKSFFPYLAIIATIIISTVLLSFKNIEPQPVELGKVNWLRNMEEAQAASVKQQKPILILFQEVPGCSTCQRYGNGPLSHPLIVEAIETLFVPLAIYNNKGGEDRKVLNYFNEPTWNNPVVRIVSADKQDVTPRLGGNYSSFGLVSSMLLALDKSNLVAPRYLQLLGEELQAEVTGTEEATLSMYCFWTGEKEIGKIPGVISTEAGFMGGREVVQVEYNPLVLPYEDLVKKAQQASCASHVFTENNTEEKAAAKVVGERAVSQKGNYRTDKEPKYYLSKTHWKYVPMTKLQAVKANSLVGQRQAPDAVLSPRQIELAAFIAKNKDKKWKDMIGEDVVAGWETVEQMD